MTDKLRRTAPVNITVVDGEAPTAAKITAINSQIRRSTYILEKAIGDLWNQSGDALTVNYPLQIPNLARAVGEMKYLNPVFYPTTENFVYVDNIGAKFPGQHEIYLQFVPADVSAITISGGSLSTANRKSNKYDVDAAGDWFVDSTTGKLYTFTAIAAADEFTYTVDVSTWNIQDETLPNIIPDPRQNAFTNCRISKSGSTYYIHLPPRAPFTLDFDGGLFNGWSLPDRYPPSTDLSDNYDTSVGATGAKKLWQDPTANALGDAYYRYGLPKEIKDQLSSLSEGDLLPEGLLYVWNTNTGTIVSDVQLRKGPSSGSLAGDWIFQISSDSVDLDTLDTDTETLASYNSTGLKIIAVGSSLSRSLWTLWNALFSHTHNNIGDFSEPLQHSSLIETNPPTSSYSGHSSRYPTDVPAWSPSRWAFDDHVSLLSRAGSQGTAGGRNRDVNDNAMLGDLVLASTTASGGNYLNNSSNSNRIYFGSIATGPSIHGFGANDPLIGTSYGIKIEPGSATDGILLYISDNGDSDIVYGIYSDSLCRSEGFIAEASGSDLGVNSSAVNGYGVYGQSESSYGVYGKSTHSWGVYGQSESSYAIVAQGDTTSPTKSALRLVPQNAAPSLPAEGDIYVNSVTHHIYCYLNSSWVQLDN